MAMTNAEWMLKQGMKFSRLAWGYTNGKSIVYYETGEHFEDNTEPQESTKELYSEKSTTMKNIILKWLDMEHAEPILDDAERRYLATVVKPFRKQVKSISKSQTNEGELICIDTKNRYLVFPPFEKGTKYKGMKLDWDYTLEELGI